MEDNTSQTPTLLGRDQELDILNQHLKKALDSKGTTYLISGVTGVGKSTLMEALKQDLEQRDITIFSGMAEQNSTRPFQLLTNVFSQLSEKPILEEQQITKFVKIFAVNKAGLLMAEASDEQDIDSDVFAGMLTAVQGFVRDSLDQDGMEKGRLGRLEYGDMKILMENSQNLVLTTIIHGSEHPNMKFTMKATLRDIEEKHHKILDSWKGSVKDLAPIQEQISELGKKEFMVRKDLDGLRLETERIRIAEGVLLALHDLAGERPITIFLENLQWADESSLFVLNYLARNIGECPILILGALRPRESDMLHHYMDQMMSEGSVNILELEKFGPEGTENLINQICQPNDFPKTFFEKLYYQSKGNPLFIKEMLKSMQVEGSIVQDRKYSLVSESFHVPKTVEEVLNHRLDKLDTDSISMAEYAACIGQSFHPSLALSNSLLKEAKTSLNKLIEFGILIEKEGILEFSNSLFQNLIYDSMGNRWKINNHRSIGEYIEQIYGDNIEDVVFDLARNFSRTNEHKKAAEYCFSAGERAEATFAMEQALAFYKDAISSLSVLKDKERMILTHERLADILVVLGNYDEAIAEFKRTRNMTGEKEIQARLLRKCGITLEKQGRYDAAIDILEDAKGLLDDNSAEYGRILFAQGNPLWRKGDYEEALKAFHKSVRVAEAIGSDLQDLGNAYRGIGNIHLNRADYDEAYEYFENSLDIMKRINYEYGIAAALNNMGNVHQFRGDLDEALESYEQSLHILEKIREPQGLGWSLNNIGNVLMYNGDMEKALEYHKRSMEIRQRTGDRQGLATSLTNIGIMNHMQGNLGKALHYHGQSMDLRQQIGDVKGVAGALNTMGDLQMLLGDLEKAKELIEKGLAIRDTIGNKHGLAGSYNSLGTVFMELGNPKDALKYLEKGLKICEEIDDNRQIIFALSHIAEIQRKLGEQEGALKNGLRAVELAHKIGAVAELAMSRRCLGNTYRSIGKLKEAEMELKGAAAALEKAIDAVQDAKLFYDLALLYHDLDENDKAKHYAGKARRSFESMGMNAWAERCNRK